MHPLLASNGSTYIGPFKDEKSHGVGKIVYAKGNENKFVEYEGDFFEGRIEGYGIMKYANGDIYEGNWKRGLRHGKGKMEMFNSDKTYIGKWRGDVQHGKGKLFYKDGNHYEGIWENGDRKR